MLRRVATNTRRYVLRAPKSALYSRAYIAIDSAGSFRPPPGKTVGTSQQNPLPNASYREAFVVRLPQARVIGMAGHVLTREGTLLADASFEFPNTFYRDGAWRALQGNLEPVQPLSGITCIFTTPWAHHNYFHYLFELLPRCEMLRRSGIPPGTINHFITSPFQFNVFWDGLNVLGIPRERSRICSLGSVFECESLIAPSTLRGTGHRRKWVCEWLNRMFAPTNTPRSGTLRLYVGRDDAPRRRLINQDEILQVLLPLGFQHVNWDGRSIQEQAALFAQASVIVGLNGAALSNLVFSKPGTRVLVLHHPGRLSHYFYELCHTVGLDYYYLVGKTILPTNHSEYASDYIVEPDKLAALLQLARVN